MTTIDDTFEPDVVQTLPLNSTKKHSIRFDANSSDALLAFTSLYLSKGVLPVEKGIQQIPTAIKIGVEFIYD